MITLAMPQELVAQAVCAQVDPELFFPEKGGSVLLPKRLCGTCPVQAECLGWALANDIQHGVWGGLSQKDRRDRRRNAA